MMEGMEVDFNAGNEALLQAIALLTDENDLSAKIQSLLSSVEEDKSRTIAICEVLALQTQEENKKKKLAELLDKISKLWTRLMDDREKMLLTISNIEMEKEAIQKKIDDPRKIYEEILDKHSPNKKRSRIKISKNLFSANIGEDKKNADEEGSDAQP